jgi:hypothetical protein
MGGVDPTTAHLHFNRGLISAADAVGVLTP